MNYHYPSGSWTIHNSTKIIKLNASLTYKGK